MFFSNPEPEANWTQEDFVSWARAYEGLIFDHGPWAHPAHAYRWALVPQFPLQRLNGPDDWCAWFNDELSLYEDDLRGWRDLLTDPIREPIIVIDSDEGAGIWDGWHRAGASVHLGHTHISALVGTL